MLKEQKIKKEIFDNICKSTKYTDYIEDSVLDYKDQLIDELFVEQPKLGEEIKSKISKFKKELVKKLFIEEFKMNDIDAQTLSETKVVPHLKQLKDI